MRLDLCERALLGLHHEKPRKDYRRCVNHLHIRQSIIMMHRCSHNLPPLTQQRHQQRLQKSASAHVRLHGDSC